jgi:hypothetical protein
VDPLGEAGASLPVVAGAVGAVVDVAEAAGTDAGRVPVPAPPGTVLLLGSPRLEQVTATAAMTRPMTRATAALRRQ